MSKLFNIKSQQRITTSPPSSRPPKLTISHFKLTNGHFVKTSSKLSSSASTSKNNLLNPKKFQTSYSNSSSSSHSNLHPPFSLSSSSPLHPLLLGSCVFAFALLSTAFISSSFSPSSTTSADTSVNLRVTIPEALSISTSNSNVVLSPDINGNIASDSTNIIITTSNNNGYTLSISSASEETALVNSSNNEYKIPTLSSSTTLANFPINTWGYSTDNTNFLGLPPLSSSTNLKVAYTAVDNDTTNLTFATRVNAAMGAGDYSNTIMLTAVPHLTHLNPLSSITNMQDMSSTLCDAAIVGDSATLTDSRDGKTYTIKKLSDDKCWMTQNLALTGSRTLTSNDSDVTSNFELKSANTGTWCTDNNATCINQSLHRLSDQSGSTGISYGGYYNWYTATAGTGTYEKSSGNVSSSICPKGWRLPTSTSSGDFQALYRAIGSTPANMTSTSGGNPGFVFSGYYSGSQFGNVGEHGSCWSSTANDSNYAYRLRFYNINVLPSDSNRKYSGSAVRCVAR